MVACVGESLIDMVNNREFVGGCPFNVALAASRLGAPVSFFGKVSSDRQGLMILERMIDNGVLFDPELCNAPEPTLCSKAVLDADGKASYVFDYKGTAACAITEPELSLSFSNEGDINLVFFGSISLVMEPGCKAILDALDKMEGDPAFFLDPNVRPSMISDPESYRRMILALAGKSDLVRVSDEDLAFLCPGLDPDEAENRLRDACKGALIVTRGDRGSSWFSKTFRVDCPAFIAGEVVDTIGCGDTFDGAVIAYLDRGGLTGRIGELDKETVLEMLDYASKAAGLNCLFEGCDPPRRATGDELAM